MDSLDDKRLKFVICLEVKVICIMEMRTQKFNVEIKPSKSLGWLINFGSNEMHNKSYLSVYVKYDNSVNF